MSEQIREQVSAFLDGELPNSESELLLKRLTRDAELRDSFGRYALMGEAMRGDHGTVLPRGFPARVNSAIDGEVQPVSPPPVLQRPPRSWRPFAGMAMVASVAAFAVVALQHRTVGPMTAVNTPHRTAQDLPGGVGGADAPAGARSALLGAITREPLSYTTPLVGGADSVPVGTLPASYVFAHSKYSSGLGQRGVLADLLIEDDVPPTELAPAAVRTPAP